MTLPIHAVLPDLLAALQRAPNAVLVAPPGAGKTTAVAPALLDQPWCNGRILLLSPRRLAARAAAERIAELLDCPLGGLVGYATRMDSRQSADTRILVLTEGIFRNQIQADPELAGISVVLFDEVHERSLDSDFGLALALDAQAGLRPDLRLVAMSATLDGARFAALLNGPVIESAGKMFPLSLRHIGRRAEARIEDEMAAAMRRALAEEPGDILAFLPGVGEIERTRERLAGVEADVFPLHGSLDPKEQRAALRPATRRKIILATSIAETSLTIDGVRIVIDSGLARRARYDRAAGLSRLVTERVSQAAATQRAGRAARQQPGIAYRLWEEAATSGLMPFDPPEILEADLSALLLDCLIWGVRDPQSLNWLDAPPAAALAEAWARLRSWGAVDAEDRPTPHGRAMAQLPLPPRLAHMLLKAAEAGAADMAAQAAVLLSERGLGGNDADLDQRLTRWQRENGPRAEAARGLARRWAKQAQRLVTSAGGLNELSLDSILALGFPDRVAKRRDAKGENWISVGGRGFRLDPSSPLARADWLAVADIQGAASGARILSAVPTDQGRMEALFADQIQQGARLDFDPSTGSVRAESGRHLGAITLSKGQDSKVSSDDISAALVNGVRTHGLDVLTWPEAASRLRTRARWAGLEVLEDAVLLDQLDLWLPPLVAGKRRLSDVDDAALMQALKNLIGWEGQQTLDRLAPASFTSPAGTTHAIDYGAEAGPTVELRVQALFGLADHPVIGPDRTPLVLSLTSPAGRPIQTTRDLPGFWAGSWRDVAKEMRGAYPKHNWPDDPAAATASLKTKKAQARG
ncbi:MAG: ATP-dependent helicase HrpB [Alphaproteobacteria bacterium]|nr:ATP-dependent helicase HrpB [Alphaproteobacteria bacterium]